MTHAVPRRPRFRFGRWSMTRSVIDILEARHIEKPLTSILDVGCSGGKWGILLAELFEQSDGVQIDGVEADESLWSFLHQQVYRRVYWSTVAGALEGLGRYDVVLISPDALDADRSVTGLQLERLLRLAVRDTLVLPPRESPPCFPLSDEGVERYGAIRGPGGLLVFPPVTPAQIVSCAGVLDKGEGKLCLVEGAELVLQVGTQRYLELELGNHQWSSALEVRDEEGRIVRSEPLFDEEDRRSSIVVEIGRARELHLRAVPHPAAKGVEAWIHAWR